MLEFKNQSENSKKEAVSGKNLTPNFSKIREVKNTHNILTFFQQTLLNPLDTWGVSRKDALDYFKYSPYWVKKFQDYFQHIHAKGEKVVYVDICGQATGENLGADQSFSFSLKAPQHRQVPNALFVSGDIFNPTDFSGFLKTIKESGTAPALVTFNPVYGLSTYNSKGRPENIVPEMYDKITNEGLLKRLRDIVIILKPGGYVCFTSPFEFKDNPSEIIKSVRELAQKLKCELEVDTPKIPQFLLRKPKELA